MAITVTDVEAAMAEYYKLHPDKAQCLRSKETLRLFNPRGEAMQGQKFHIKTWLNPSRGARRVNAVTAESSEWPEARKANWQDWYIEWSDLTEYRTTVEYTGLAEDKTADAKMCVYKTAEKYIGMVDDDIATQVNNSIHQSTNCKIAAIAAKYHDDGTAYTNNTHTTAYFQIKGGSIVQIMQNDRIEIRAGTSTTSTRVICYVNDVYPGTNGPGGTADIGPGFTATYESTGQTGGATTNFDSAAADDELVLSGETSANIFGFPSFFSWTTAMYSLTRTTLGNGWTIPKLMYDYSVAGAAVDFDPEIHFATMALDLAYAVQNGRNMRQGDGIKMTANAMVALGDPEVVDEMSRLGGDRVKYTKELSAAQKQDIIGSIGFDGAWFHHPNIGPIAIQSDPAATPRTIRYLDPNSWFWVTGGLGGPTSVRWLDKDGKKFRNQPGANGRPKDVWVGGAHARVALVNDCPGANAQISGVKSSLRSA